MSELMEKWSRWAPNEETARVLDVLSRCAARLPEDSPLYDEVLDVLDSLAGYCAAQTKTMVVRRTPSR